MEADWVVRTLKKALQSKGSPEIFNSDQGSQFTSDEYISYEESLKAVDISIDGKGRSTDNAYLERFFRTTKYDIPYLNPSANGHKLFTECKTVILSHNGKRTHSAMGRAKPAERFKRVA